MDNMKNSFNFIQFLKYICNTYTDIIQAQLIAPLLTIFNALDIAKNNYFLIFLFLQA